MTIDWDVQNAIFLDDNEWQLRMRDSILVPYYERTYPGRYELIDPKNDPRADGGCDTILNGQRVDEKIVRWPIDKETKKPREYGYDAFALETWSCTIEGHVKLGWMATNDVVFILYCFVSLDQQSMICYLIDYHQLHKWFYSHPEDRWPPSYSKQANRTLVRVVPIVEVMANVEVKTFTLTRPATKIQQPKRKTLHGAIGKQLPSGRWIAVSFQENWVELNGKWVLESTVEGKDELR